MLLPQVLQGKTGAQGCTLDVRSNFEQYGLVPRLAGFLATDMHRQPLRRGLEEVR